MILESSVTEIQIRFYDEPKVEGRKPKYKSSLPVKIFGPRAILTSLSLENDFYKNFDLIWDFVNLNCDTNIWHCHIVERHYLVVLRKISKRYNVEVIANEKNAKRDMIWIQVTKK